MSKCSDEEFIALFEQFGPSETAKQLGVDVRNVHARRRRLEGRLQRPIIAPKGVDSRANYEQKLTISVPDGIVLIGSDAHYWPGEATTAHRAFVTFAREMNPKAVILNGDVLDGARISRHPRIGWAKTPTLKEELEACQDRTDEILNAAPNAQAVWTLGNHCMRFDSYLSSKASEAEAISGTMLKDHFPEWDFAMAAFINGDCVVKHRFKGGIHATHNNTLWAGKTVVTGHLHSLKVTPFADYNGNRFGVDTGTLSDPYGEHAAYTECNPLNHRSGFIVLTFVDGRLLWPEIVHVIGEGKVEFRGQIIDV